MPLPPSLSPRLLGKILRYVTSQRRKLETDLEKEPQSDWRRLQDSDDEFYERLHNFLQNDLLRSRFNQIAKRHSNKRRSLALPDSILAYYKFPTPSDDAGYSAEDVLEKVFEADEDIADIEAPANVIWALLENNEVDIDFVQRMLVKSPALRDQLVESVSDRTKGDLQADWHEAVVNLRGIVDELDTTTPDIDLAVRLVACAGALQSMAESQHARFWDEIDAIFDEYSEYAEENGVLAEIAESLARVDRLKDVPKSWVSALPVIRTSPLEFKTEDDNCRKLSDSLTSSAFGERPALVEEINLSMTRQKAALEAAKAAFVSLSPVGAGSESTPMSDEATITPAGEENVHGPESQPEPIPSNEEVSNIDDAEATDAPDDEGDAGQPDEQGHEPGSDGDMSDIGHSPVESGSNDSSSNGAKEGNEVEHPTSPTSAEPTKERALELLDEMLRNGDFAHAYWLAHSTGTFEDSILGVLAEGARVEAGSTCSVRLAQLISELPDLSDTADDDKKLLLVAAILQPMLLLRTYPEALYQVISTVPSTVLDGFVENFRKTYLAQGIILGPRTIQPNGEAANIEERLQELAEESSEFLARLPSMRFGYQPAETVIRHLYGSSSGWRRVHEIVAKQQTARVDEVRALCEELDPLVFSSIHNQIPGQRKQLVGHARDKLAKHLHDTIELATGWVRLVEELTGHEPERREQQERDLKKAAIEGLQGVLSSFNDVENGTAVIAAAVVRFKDLLMKLNGEKVAAIGLDDACINLPSLPLDDDMRPSLSDDNCIVDSMEKVLLGNADPIGVFAECLERDEFVRADRLITQYGLGADATRRLELARDERRTALRRQLNNLSSKVEEAFLLGQLWDPGENSKTRAELTSVIDEGLERLKAEDSSLNSNIRNVSRIGEQIEARMEEVTRDRMSYLERERTALVEMFQKIGRGKEDRDYFIDAFSNCLEQEDHVAAFDLLDRARYAVDKGEPIARSGSMAPSERFLEFLKIADKYGAAAPRGLRQNIGSIQRGDTVFGIPFGQVDRARRREAESVLEAWSLIGKTKDGGVADSVEEVCRFAGFPIVVGNTQRCRTVGDGYLHFRVELEPVVPKSPLPSFGSLLGAHLDVVVCQRPQEPLQVLEFCNEAGIRGGKAALVLLTRTARSQYRLKWLQACSRSQAMALPMDNCLLMYLCGARNRRQALLDAGLPFTWAQPYITKGETVAREMFVGRTDEVKDIVERSGRCIVCGGRQLGKSALLTHVRSEYHDPQEGCGLFVAYVDVNDLGEAQTQKEMMDAFWQRVSGQLTLVGFLEQISTAKRGLRERIPGAIEAALTENEEMRLILLLDETDKLLDLDSQADFELVRRLRTLMANTQRRFKVVLAGLQSVQRYQQFPVSGAGTPVVG